MSADWTHGDSRVAGNAFWAAQQAACPASARFKADAVHERSRRAVSGLGLSSGLPCYRLAG